MIFLKQKLSRAPFIERLTIDLTWNSKAARLQGCKAATTMPKNSAAFLQTDIKSVDLKWFWGQPISGQDIRTPQFLSVIIALTTKFTSRRRKLSIFCIQWPGACVDHREYYWINFDPKSWLTHVPIASRWQIGLEWKKRIMPWLIYCDFDFVSYRDQVNSDTCRTVS